MIGNKKAIVLLVVCLLAWAGWDVYSFQKKALTVLAYHSVMREASEINGEYSISERDFAGQLEWLWQSGYTPVSLSDVLRARATGEQLPEKPLAITFDDGYKDNFYIAMPVLQRYGFSATVFVVTDFLGSDAFLSWDELAILREAGGITIGSHTASHRPLAGITEREARDELVKSRQLLQEKGGVDTVFLAYPFGSYSQKLLPLARETGYQVACTGKTGVNAPAAPLLALKRINVPQSKYGLWNFKARIWYGTLSSWCSQLVMS